MLVMVFIIHINKIKKNCYKKGSKMFVYYTLKILFVLYDNCDDTYSFYLLFHILVSYVTRILCLWK